VVLGIEWEPHILTNYSLDLYFCQKNVKLVIDYFCPRLKNQFNISYKKINTKSEI